MNKTKEIIEKLKKISGKKNHQHIYQYLILILLSFFLFLNIVFSQDISPLFLGVVNLNKKDVVIFLEKIKPNNFFTDQLKYFENFYGKSLEKEVFAKENAKKQKIKKLEQILEKNPYSRDVLYQLFQEYQALDDEKKAQEYFLKAKTVDPEIL
ncbi:MAG: hypothetical protein KatS3mg092_0391 [Patescibacteria group bacterium]|nr:MAG: hypothetical protein KatS3mg092_0391 [Patescibacteria group bacterium]